MEEVRLTVQLCDACFGEKPCEKESVHGAEAAARFVQRQDASYLRTSSLRWRGSAAAPAIHVPWGAAGEETERQSQRSGKSVLVQPRGSADKHTYLWDARGINNQTNGDNYFWKSLVNPIER